MGQSQSHRCLKGHLPQGPVRPHPEAKNPKEQSAGQWMVKTASTETAYPMKGLLPRIGPELQKPPPPQPQRYHLRV